MAEGALARAPRLLRQCVPQDTAAEMENSTTASREAPELYGSGPAWSTLVPVLLNRSSILPARNSIAMIRRIAIEAMMRPYGRTSP